MSVIIFALIKLQLMSRASADKFPRRGKGNRKKDQNTAKKKTEK